MDRSRMKLGDKVMIPAVVEKIEYTTMGEISYKVEPLTTWFDADEIEALKQTESEQYKKGFEDAKRAFLIEYARESESMRRRNAQLEVMLNVQKAISAEAVQGNAESATTTDCISRQEALNIFADIKRHLLSLPPVEPKQSKGEWKYGNGNGECPFCGRERQLGWDNFCGFCGADMRGEK